MKKKTDTIIGPGSLFEGEFHIVGKMKVMGTCRGKVEVSDDLYISPEGVMYSEVVTQRAIIAGRLEGNIKSKEELNILSTGVVEGSIETKSFLVRNGGVTHGAINITGQTQSTSS